MFCSDDVLKSYNLSAAWRAAHDHNYPEACIPDVCDGIRKWITSNHRDPRRRMSLRTSATLIGGVTKIYKRKVTKLIEDCTKWAKKFRKRRRMSVDDGTPLSTSDTSDVYSSPEEMLPETMLPIRTSTPIASCTTPEMARRQAESLPDISNTSFMSGIMARQSIEQLDVPEFQHSLSVISDHTEESTTEDPDHQNLQLEMSNHSDTLEAPKRIKRRDSIYVPRSDSSGRTTPIIHVSSYQQPSQHQVTEDTGHDDKTKSYKAEEENQTSRKSKLSASQRKKGLILTFKTTDLYRTSFIQESASKDSNLTLINSGSKSKDLSGPLINSGGAEIDMNMNININSESSGKYSNESLINIGCAGKDSNEPLINSGSAGKDSNEPLINSKSPEKTTETSKDVCSKPTSEEMDAERPGPSRVSHGVQTSPLRRPQPLYKNLPFASIMLYKNYYSRIPSKILFRTITKKQQKKVFTRIL